MDTNLDDFLCITLNFILICSQSLGFRGWNNFCEAWRQVKIAKSLLKLSSLKSKHQKGCFITRHALAFQLFVSLRWSRSGIEDGSWQIINRNYLNFNSKLSLIKQKWTHLYQDNASLVRPLIQNYQATTNSRDPILTYGEGPLSKFLGLGQWFGYKAKSREGRIWNIWLLNFFRSDRDTPSISYIYYAFKINVQIKRKQRNILFQNECNI